MSSVRVAPGASAPTRQVTVWPSASHSNEEPVGTNASPAGSVSRTITVVAVLGPRLTTGTWKCTVSPARAAGPTADLLSARSAACVTVVAERAIAGPELGVVVVARASLATVPEKAGSTLVVSVTVRSAPAPSAPNAQVTSWPANAHSGAGATATIVSADGTASRSPTAAAADGRR